ncbi:MAG: hypothetical protein K8S87_00275 [Planctomycetes bacterium]|nr:hypothetical protein [Planctomycetota bacterium]
MLSFMKKEIKLIIISMLTLILVSTVNMFGINPEKDKTSKDLIKAKSSVSRWEKEIQEIFKYYNEYDLELAPPRTHTKYFQQKNSDSLEKERALQNVVAFEVKENFKIPKKIIREAQEENYPQLINDYANQKIAELLDETYTKLESAKYKFLKPLKFDSQLVQENMSFELYQTEGLALIGKKEEEVGMLKDVEQQNLIRAEAEATMKLIQLNIIKAVVENARLAGVSRIDEMIFVSRPKELTSRFNVKVNEPRYYRPIVIKVNFFADELSTFDFVKFCIDPSPSGSTGEFLAIHSFMLDNPDALKANTPSLSVATEMVLVAFIIDPNSPYSEFEKPKRKSLVPTYGPVFKGR